MKKLIIFCIIAALFVTGCTQKKASIKLVWPTESHRLFLKTYGPDIKTVSTPPGFIISPSEVFDKSLPCKYLITIYADDEFYYVVKDRGNSQKAEQFGIKVNGKTGKVDFPKVINRYTPLHYGGVSSRNAQTPSLP